MSDAIIMDIETTRHRDAEKFLPEFKAPKNIKDPKKIEDNLIEQRRKALVKAALNAVTGRVIAVGLMKEDRSWMKLDIIRECAQWTDTFERELIERTWYFLTHRDSMGHLVTFCGHMFDIPFLVRRSWALDIKVPDWIPRGEYVNRKLFYDVAEAWNATSRGDSISLDVLARHMGWEGKKDTGDAFARMLENREFTRAEEYLTYDLNVTAEAYRRGKRDKPLMS